MGPGHRCVANHLSWAAARQEVGATMGLAQQRCVSRLAPSPSLQPSISSVSAVRGVRPSNPRDLRRLASKQTIFFSDADEGTRSRVRHSCKWAALVTNSAISHACDAQAASSARQSHAWQPRVAVPPPMFRRPVPYGHVSLTITYQTLDARRARPERPLPQAPVAQARRCGWRADLPLE